MYVERLNVGQFRVFKNLKADLLHSESDFEALELPRPKLPNVNLLLGGNGAGKSSFLKALAIACLGPSAPDANLPLYRLIRRSGSDTEPLNEALIEASFALHGQDRPGSKEGGGRIKASTRIIFPGESREVERIVWGGSSEELWKPIYSSESQAFFFVGYSANRAVQRASLFDEGARQKTAFRRAQRVRSLFDESYPLAPLTSWLPDLKKRNPGRFNQAADLMNKLLSGTGCKFTGEVDQGEYIFVLNSLPAPFPALSDGYRAYIGWIGDMLYHISSTCPKGKKLIDNCGIVMVDEIDLHLHPSWQMTVLPCLAKALPKIQFIVTTHSPLVVGSLEWMNILVMDFKRGSASARRLDQAVHGMDADQILLTDFFGLKSTRSPGKERRLKELTLKFSEGDESAALELMSLLSGGEESRA